MRASFRCDWTTLEYESDDDKEEEEAYCRESWNKLSPRGNCVFC